MQGAHPADAPPTLAPESSLELSLVELRCEEILLEKTADGPVPWDLIMLGAAKPGKSGERLHAVRKALKRLAKRVPENSAAHAGADDQDFLFVVLELCEHKARSPLLLGQR